MIDIANDAVEGERLSAAFGYHGVLVMGNHGVSVTAPTVAEAFEDPGYELRALVDTDGLWIADFPAHPIQHGNKIFTPIAEPRIENW